MAIMVELFRSLVLVLLIQLGVFVSVKILIKIFVSHRQDIFNFLSPFSLFSQEGILPHPPKLPLVGNLLQLAVRPLEKLNQWSKKYGPIYGIHLGQKYFIILNNHEVVNDLIVKNGSTNSSRYDFNNSNPILVKSNLIALAPNGDKWKRDRSVAYSALVSRPIKSYNDYISKDTEQLVRDLMTTHGQPHYPLQIIKKFVLRNMLNILFGIQTKRNDPFFDDVMRVMDEIAEYSSPTNVLTDFMPFLDRVHKPNTDKAERLFRQVELIFSSKYDEFLRAYRNRNSETLPPSFLLQIQDEIKENSSVKYEDIWKMLVSLLNGAMETEVNTLMWAIACLANNPGVQEGAFIELDNLCEKQMPAIGDEMDLPYIDAIINETLRFRPPNPFGFAHIAGKDDVYNGYFIPKGTPILLNLFAINHNERRFISPDKFRPSRFLQDYSTGSVKSKSILLPQFDYDAGIEGEILNRKRSSLKGILKNNCPSLTNSSMPMHMSFGAGRRYCIGQHIAQKQLFHALARILWAFEIKPAIGEDLKTLSEVNLNDGKVSLTSYSPSPYKVRFLLRKDIGLLI